MAIQDAILHFATAHSSLLSALEKLALHEVIALLRGLYPNDPAMIAIIQKISDEVLKLQGIQPDQSA
jgi:hypothetical protein